MYSVLFIWVLSIYLLLIRRIRHPKTGSNSTGNNRIRSTMFYQPACCMILNFFDCIAHNKLYACLSVHALTHMSVHVTVHVLHLPCLFMNKLSTCRPAKTKPIQFDPFLIPKESAEDRHHHHNRHHLLTTTMPTTTTTSEALQVPLSPSLPPLRPPL